MPSSDGDTAPAPAPTRQLVQGQGATSSSGYPTAAEHIALKIDAFRQWLIDPPYTMEYHRDNLLFLISYYENGGTEPPPGQTRWIMDGKILDYEPTFPTPSPALGDNVCHLSPVVSFNWLAYSICSATYFISGDSLEFQRPRPRLFRWHS